MEQYTAKDILEGTDEDFDNDLNGECFIAGAEGEAEVFIENNIVLFPADFPTASETSIGNKIEISNNAMAAFIVLNAKACIEHGRAGNEAAKIAYIRFLAARNGIISPSFSTTVHNVRYNHAVLAHATVADCLNKKENGDVIKAVKDTLNAETRRSISQKFTNLVCCVAYMFRVRGHHYMADFRSKYDTIWARCLYRPEELPLDWELVATDALHAVMPDVLDGFWVEAANNARCAGTLIKRLDSAPAGAAGVVALERGLNDVMMLFPAVVEKVPEAYEEFKKVVRQVRGPRWNGSINARFYGVARIRVDEAKIGSLASVVLGIYENLSPNSKLRESNALRRLAEIAPATGGALGMAAARAAKDERLNLIDYTTPLPQGQIVGATS